MEAADEVSKRWPISGEVLTLTDPITDSPHVAEDLINMTSAVGFRHCTPTAKPKERINIHDFGDVGMRASAADRAMTWLRRKAPTVCQRPLPAA
jgi:hypothetical protein